MKKIEKSFAELVLELQASVDEVPETQSESVMELSVFVEELCQILIELKDNKLMDTPPVRKAMESVEFEVKRARCLMKCLNDRGLKQIEDVTQNLGRSLGLLLFSCHDISIIGKEKIEALRKEMMNARFDSGSLEIVDEIVDDDDDNWSVDDVVMQLKYGNDEEFLRAVSRFNVMISETAAATNEFVNDEGIIPILFSRLNAGMPKNRVTIIQLLRSLIIFNDENKEKMGDVGYLTTLVKSLTRDTDEQREAVGILSSVSQISAIRRRIGRIQGCIVMLVAILNSQDLSASHDAGKLLNALSSNTQNALHMAEAGYFKPLVRYLKQGSDMSKILMATALSRMELRDQTRSSIGEEGAIEPLVRMFKDGKLESKLSALKALQNLLSNSKQNTKRLIKSGVISSLLQLLFSVTSVLMTLREPASAILAKIAESESILVNYDIALQMLSLLNLSSPVIQSHLLHALNSICSHSSAAKVRKKMSDNGAVQLLLPFLVEPNPKIRLVALVLVCTLTKHSPDGLMEQLGETHLNIIVSIISSSISEPELTAAVGILSNLPVNDKKATDLLKKANILPILSSMVSSDTDKSLVECITGVFIRFTIHSDKKLQFFAAENGVIPVLVNVLSYGTITAKSRAATSLAQLSNNTLTLSKSKKSRWRCVPPLSDAFCTVHDGYCFAKTTFCLIKANVVVPLIKILEGDKRGADVEVLTAIATLLQDEIWEQGSHYLAKTEAVAAIIKVLELGNVKAQEKAVWILEKFFRIEDHRIKYGESAQLILIELAQKGDVILKPAVAKLLAQLELLQVQSSYFS